MPLERVEVHPEGVRGDGLDHVSVGDDDLDRVDDRPTDSRAFQSRTAPTARA